MKQVGSEIVTFTDKIYRMPGRDRKECTCKCSIGSYSGARWRRDVGHSLGHHVGHVLSGVGCMLGFGGRVL